MTELKYLSESRNFFEKYREEKGICSSPRQDCSEVCSCEGMYELGYWDDDGPLLLAKFMEVMFDKINSTRRHEA